MEEYRFFWDNDLQGYTYDTLDNILNNKNSKLFNDFELSCLMDNEFVKPTIQELKLFRKKEYSTYNHEMLKFGIDHELDIEVQDLEVCAFQYLHLHNEDFAEKYNHYMNVFMDLYEEKHVWFPSLFKNYFRNEFVKMNRLFERIEHITDFVNDKYAAYFLTLTLRDTYTIESITRDKYTNVRTKIRKFVSNYSEHYVMNKDFGLNDTKRLHFHGVAIIKKSELSSFKFHYKKKFGINTLDLIDEHSDRIARYIEKLSYHALKVNYGFNKENLIYSREEFNYFDSLASFIRKKIIAY